MRDVLAYIKNIWRFAFMNDVAQPVKTTSVPLVRRTPVIIGVIVVLATIGASIVAYQMGGNTTPNARQVQSTPKPSSFFTQEPSQDPTPTPTPLLGPGPFACDPYGFCNAYEDSKLVGCPKTYADRFCLNECQKTNVRCPK